MIDVIKINQEEIHKYDWLFDYGRWYLFAFPFLVLFVCCIIEWRKTGGKLNIIYCLSWIGDRLVIVVPLLVLSIWFNPITGGIAALLWLISSNGSAEEIRSTFLIVLFSFVFITSLLVYGRATAKNNDSRVFIDSCIACVVIPLIPTLMKV